MEKIFELVQDQAEFAEALAKAGGSGKKYKKCGLINSTERQQPMAERK